MDTKSYQNAPRTMASSSEYSKLEVEDPSYYDSYPIKPKNGLKQQHVRGLISRRSWLHSCCCCLVISLAIFTVFLGVAATCAFAWTKKQVVRVTVEDPLPDFPIVEMSLAELEVVKDRAVLFVDTLKAGKEVPDDLILTQHDFNGLIGHGEDLRGKAYVDIHDDLFEIKTSLPTEGLPGGKGRYFVSSGSVMKVSSDNVLALLDTLKPIDDLNDPLFMADLDISRRGDESTGSKWSAIVNSGTEFMGWHVPEDFIEQRKNLLEDLYNDPDTHDDIEVLNAVSSISIQEGQIVVKAKKGYLAASFDSMETTAIVSPKPPRSFLRRLLL